MAAKKKPKPACTALTGDAAASIAASIKAGKPTNLRYVKSTETGDIAGLKREGMVIIAADLGDRRLVWAASGDFPQRGGGFVVGLDENTKKVSELGADIAEGALGVSMSTQGVTEVLTCTP